MMIARFSVLMLFLSFQLSVFAQNKYTVNVYVRDSVSGESIISATITIDGKAVNSNQYGFYSLTLPEGEYDFGASHVSYLTAFYRISLKQNLQQNILLVPKSAALNEVVVYSRKRDANVRNAQMGKIDLSIGQIKSIPALLGEVDILKAIQLLPGVQTAGEGNSGFYVRGGGPDQNLIILDDAVVYNTGHLFGFFSIFNSDAIKKVSLIISARRTYVDALAKPFISRESNAYGSGYYFYDLNTKINYKFSEKDKL